MTVHNSRWRDQRGNISEIASELLTPFDAGLMRSFLVSSRINHVADDDEE